MRVPLPDLAEDLKPFGPLKVTEQTMSKVMESEMVVLARPPRALGIGQTSVNIVGSRPRAQILCAKARHDLVDVVGIDGLVPRQLVQEVPYILTIP
jgi:hypothetical protein